MDEQARGPAVLGISGWHNSGKTTLVEALVVALRADGLRVCTIKHAAQGFELDAPASDSRRMWEAGANVVAIVGPDEVLMRERIAEPSLSDAIARLEGRCDVVLVEGFKRERLPRVVIQVADSARLPEADAIYVVRVGPEGLRRGSEALALTLEGVLEWLKMGRFV
jgi:molybdopterin-guanine dinucleotide biosynthesis adapter protein